MTCGGSDTGTKGSLHQRLKYFRKQSAINRVVGEAVQRFNKQK